MDPAAVNVEPNLCQGIPRTAVLVKLKPYRRYRHLTINYTNDNTVTVEVGTAEKVRVLQAAVSGGL